LNPCNQALSRDSTGEQIDDDQIRRGGSSAARGKWGKMTRDSRRSWGWSGLRQGGAEVAYRRRTEAAGRAPRRVDGIPVARVPEGGEEVARKLLRVDVLLLVPLAGVKRLCISGSTARPSGGGALSSSALRKMLLGCREAKLDGSVSCSGSRWCFSSTGSRVRGGMGG
jgi:hypothetical protein